MKVKPVARGPLLVATTIMAVSMCAPCAAQWLNYPTPGIPRTPDGQPDLSAATPRMPDGKPNLSGIWLPEREPAGVPGGIEGIVAPRYLIDITKDLKPGDVPFQPQAAALYKERAANSFSDNPDSMLAGRRTAPRCVYASI